MVPEPVEGLVGVSVRMLRHYDALGLLAPYAVDPHSGYRWYAVGQLDHANRLVALKDLGFSLEQVAELLAEDLPTARLVEMLVERRDELSSQVAADQDRLARVASRLSTITKENQMSTLTYTEAALGELRLVQLSAHVAEMASIEAEMGSMFGRVGELVARASATHTGPGVAHYTAEGDGIRAAAAEQVDGAVEGLESATLGACDRALVTTYDAPDLSGIAVAWQGLVAEVERRGLRTAGTAREVYHATPYDDDGGSRWVVDLQQPVA